MGIGNHGTQIISLKYKEPGKAKNFNRFNYKFLPIGIYEGGSLSYVDTTTIRVAPITAFFNEAVFGVGVKIRTTIDYDLTVDVATPYVIMRYEWIEAANNYADILAVAYGSITSEDIILGRCVYIGSTLQTSFDYTRTMTASIQTLNNKKDNFKVIAEEPYANTAYVYGGSVIINKILTTVTNQSSPTISSTTLGRIDIIYISNSGVVSVLEGVDAGSPSQPEFPVGIILAIITRGASETVVRGDQIVNVIPDRESVEGISFPTFPSGEIVGTTDTKTLSAKTLTSPDINGGTVDGITSLTVGASGTQITQITISTDAPSGGSDGDLWFVREA